MDDVLDALTAQHAELAGIIDPLDEHAWQLPSRCEGWSVADVVLHLVQTDELALASLADRIDAAVVGLATEGTPTQSSDRSEPGEPPKRSGGGELGRRDERLVRESSTNMSVDEGAELAVQRERGASGAELAARWHATSDALREAFAADDPSRRVTWVAGTLSVRTLAATRLSEAWIHTGDVGYALGSVPPPTDRLRHVARLAWRTLPYAFARSGRTLGGPVAFHLRAPSGEGWEFDPDQPAVTTVRGDAAELCLVAARRLDPAETSLGGEGPDVGSVLDLVRTYA